MMALNTRIQKPLVASLTCLAALGTHAAFALTQPPAYTTPGTYTYTVPADVVALQVAAAGGGGGGGGYDASGGGSGGIGGTGSLLNGTIPVTPGSTVTVVVGGPGTGGTSDNDGQTPAGGTGGSGQGAGGAGGQSGTSGASGSGGGARPANQN